MSQTGPVHGISAVIVSWNTAKYLKACLASLLREPAGILREIVVVDNNSSDGSADMVASDFPGVRLVRNSANLGFARANNAGIALSSGEYILVLNPDTVVPRGLLEKLAAFMDATPRAGVCGPKVTDENGRVSPWELRFATLKEAFGRDTVLGRAFPYFFRAKAAPAVFPGAAVREDWVHGCCMLVRKKAIQEAGGMEEKLFLTFEEQDWCLRLRKKRWETYYLPGAEVVHYGGRSRQQTDQLEDYLHMRRSEYIFYGKHYGLLPVLCLRAVVALSSLAALLKWAALAAAGKEDPKAGKKINFYKALLNVSLGLR